MRFLRFIPLLILLMPKIVQGQADPCDPPLTASIATSGPVCSGGIVVITFSLPDDNGDGFDVTYSVGGNTFVLTAILNGHTVEYVASTSTVATLIQVIDNDDDDDGCFTDFNQSVPVVVSAPNISISNQVDPSCGQNNGSITANGSAGTLPYQYSINGGTFQNSGTFSGLAAGSYTIEVGDAAGCTATVSTNLNDLGGPNIAISNQVNPSCGQSNGSITANGSVGTAPYQYSINGGVFQNSGTFSGLAAGSYSVVVRDAAGCTATVSTNLNDQGGPNIAISNQVNPSCGQSNGSITANGSAGTTPYQYSINGGVFQNSGTFSGLAAGSYSVVVRDAAGCTATVSTNLNDLGGPNIVISNQVNPSCGQSNGSITTNGSTGTAPYQYSINGGVFQNSGIFSGLAAGNYTVIVRDAVGCTASVSTNLNNLGGPNILISNQINPSCGQSNGSITANGSVGTAPYQYSLNGGVFQSSGTFSGLAAGSYTVVVRDAAGCTATVSTSLNNLGGPNIAISNQVSPNCGQSNGSITANGSAGTLPYQYSINGGVFQSSGTFSGLAAGSYTVQVRDAAGCQATTNVILNDASANLPKATIESSALTLCEGYDLNLKGNLPPGTTGMWSSNSLVPDNPNNPIWNLTPPAAGNFVVSWSLSAPGCPNYDVKSIQIQVIALPQALNDGAFNVNNGASVSIDMLDNDNFILPVNARIIRQPKLGSVNINNQNRIEYTAFSSSDGPDTLVYEICYSNCEESCDTATVLFRAINNDNPCVITSDTNNILTNGLTPNDDGFNDFLVFRVVSLEECEVNYARGEIMVYNRWGDVVFSASPYNNDWGGTNANGDALPPGVYYFVLRISAPERLYTQFGSVILLR